MVTTFLEEAARGEAPPLVPISADLYHQMIDRGILQEGAPIELIDGLLVRKDRSARGENLMTYGRRHALLLQRLSHLLSEWADSVGCFLHNQAPVMLNEFSVPEPDLSIVRGTYEDYPDRHPGPEELPLLIEVADSSVSTDRSTKQRLYATAGIPVYWIVNIPDAQVEVYEQPDAASGKYLRPMIYRAGQTVHFSLADQTIDIDVTRLFA